MKKMVLFISTLVLSVMLLAVVSIFHVNAATSDAYTILACPGEYADNEMNIMWHTDLENTGTYLLYTKKSDVTWAEAVKVYPEITKCTTFVGVNTIDASGNVLDQNTPFLKCVASLTDLESDTDYMYKVGQTTLSSVHYFKTGGASEYSIAVISDYHAYIKSPNRLKNGMAMVDTLEAYDQSIDFIIDVGDTVAWGGSYNFWKLNYEQENYASYMWAGLNGNHDNMDKSNSKNTNQFFAATHAYPQNGYAGEEGVCYYFVYSDTLFVILNNEDLNSSNVNIAMEWAQKAIDDNPTKYIVFLEHYQWFNFLSGSDTHYNRWKEFFDKNGVDLAISGNHHIYGRTDPVKGDKEDELGTMYLETLSSDNERGQSGCNITTGNINDFEKASETQKKFVKYCYAEGGNSVGGVIVNVTDEGIKTSFLDRYGTVLDTGFVKAKRSTPSLTIEEKNSLKNDTKYYQNEEGIGVLALPNTLTGYASSYEIYNGESLIYSSSYRNAASRFASLDLPKGMNATLTVKVTFKDDSITSYTVNIKTTQNCNLISNLKALGKNLTWEKCDQDDVTKEYKIYCNDKVLGTSTTNSYPIETAKSGDTYKVEVIDKDGKVLETLQTTYGTYGDINQDGVVDDKDVKLLQKYINGEETLTEETLTYADVNNDGKVNVQDACYVKLSKLGLISDYCLVTYQVIFMGAMGEKKETITVKAGEDATPNYTQNYEYKVVTFLTDYHNITSDQTIYAIYAKEN